jgi:hypothetical protein
VPCIEGSTSSRHAMEKKGLTGFSIHVTAQNMRSTFLAVLLPGVNVEPWVTSVCFRTVGLRFMVVHFAVHEAAKLKLEPGPGSWRSPNVRRGAAPVGKTRTRVTQEAVLLWTRAALWPGRKRGTLVSQGRSIARYRRLPLRPCTELKGGALRLGPKKREEAVVRLPAMWRLALPRKLSAAQFEGVSRRLGGSRRCWVRAPGGAVPLREVWPRERPPVEKRSLLPSGGGKNGVSWSLSRATPSEAGRSWRPTRLRAPAGAHARLFLPA